jgi:hypothetical protein
LKLIHFEDLLISVADLGFWKGGAIFSKVGAMIAKNHFLRTVPGGKNPFSFAFAGKNRKIFLEGRGDRPHRPPLNPPLVDFFSKEFR